MEQVSLIPDDVSLGVSVLKLDVCEHSLALAKLKLDATLSASQVLDPSKLALEVCDEDVLFV